MEVNLLGRIRNTQLPASKSLLPLFEAIVNSIDSIEELSERVPEHRGYINIFVRRDDRQQRVDQDDRELDPVLSFDIEDNGIGFTDKNFTSFGTSDSTYKQARGGKGVGRFLWLKAFKSVDIESVYEENSQWFKRTFKFDIDSLGIHEDNIDKTDVEARKTVVRLKSYMPTHADKVPKRAETIATRILEHCLIYFIQPTCPRITLFDLDNTYELNQIFKTTIGEATLVSGFHVDDHEFHVTYLRIDNSDDSSQRVHYCANRREVLSEPLSKFIPDLSKRIRGDDGKSQALVAYVSGDWFDGNANSERTGFYFNEEGGFEYAGGISRADLDNEFATVLRDDFAGPIQSVGSEKRQKIEEYVSDRAPQYRHVLKHDDMIDVIEPGLSSEKLDLELYKASQTIDRRMREKANQMLATNVESIEDIDNFDEKFKNVVEEINDSGKSKLAQYILHRRLILELLVKHLGVSEGKYSKEEVIHQTIFPLRSSSQDVDYDQQNLWIVDEKLSYHKYLASDLRFNQIEEIVVDDKKRPDLLIFNGPIAVVDDGYPHSSVVIVEFKRPMRKDYTDEENPIEQVYDYVEKIQSGKAVGKDGQHISVPPTLPFYCYILCDLTPKLRKYAENASLTVAPENDGFFGYNPNRRAYIEIISYQKLVADAGKRNQVLFDKLNIPLHR